MRAHVGTSGWQYGDWRGRFYPPGLPVSEWLAHYSSVFSTVEVNSSFYRLPDRATFERWATSVPAGFLAAVKASRFITHQRRLTNLGSSLDLLLDRAAGLGDRLGPILFQLPPTFARDVERLASCLAAIPANVRPAFEFRHRSWRHPKVMDLLDAHGAALVWPDRPGSRATLPVTGGWVYVRFHQGRARSPGYTAEKLRRWADRLAALDVAEQFLYFNNDAGAAAVRDAVRLRDHLRRRGLKTPPVSRPGSASRTRSGLPRSTRKPDPSIPSDR